MIVVTGAAGFIGSVIVGYLNKKGYKNIALVDNFSNPDQYKNLLNKEFDVLTIHADELRDSPIEAIIHFGANSSTLEKNWDSIYSTNVRSTRHWAKLAREKNAKMIFASSAAVYGNGNGPLNLYGFSKLISEKELNDAVCLRLFNVYGPNEYHKGRMASTIFHWFNQLQTDNELKIFQNSNQYYRDFVWVEDVARIVEFFLTNYVPGIYDVGSGTSTSFDELANQLISSLGRGKKQEIAMPTDLKSQYQTGTVADLTALSKIGFNIDQLSNTESGLVQYATYLNNHSYY
jgi:ADP-L-glycero-D-manno-heptose 6-epimerase